VFGSEAVCGNRIRIVGAGFVCIRIETGWERKPAVQRHLTDV
jgi:hypothetical protein